MMPSKRLAWCLIPKHGSTATLGIVVQLSGRKWNDPKGKFLWDHAREVTIFNTFGLTDKEVDGLPKGTDRRAVLDYIMSSRS